MTIEEFARYLRREIRRGQAEPKALLEAACTSLDMLEPEVLVSDILPARWLSKLLPHVWLFSTNFPSMWAGSDTWVKLFRRAGFVSNTSSLKRPPSDDLVVYRGTPKPDRSSALRLSWTTDRDRAVWYANRFNFPQRSQPTVWQAAIPPSGMLGFLQRGEEQEIIVNPRQLRSLQATPVKRELSTSREEFTMVLIETARAQFTR